MTTEAVRVASVRKAVRRPRMAPASLVALAFVVLLALVAVAAPLIAHYGPNDISKDVLAPPTNQHWLGTDSLGRDVFTGILFGARVSLTVGLSAAAAATAIGTIIGAYAGFRGGVLDTVIMRIAEAFQVFPAMILAALIIALFGPSITNIIVIIVLLAWPQTARVARNEAMRLKDSDFVLAARCLGRGRLRILIQEVVPNLFAPVIALGTLIVGEAILLEAGLGFLGLGVQGTVSWGEMLNEGWQAIFTAWWLSVFPGVAIFATVLSMNLMGDGFSGGRKA